MTTELLGITLIYLLSVLLAWPLGRYIARVFAGERTWSDFFAPLENLIYRLAGINPLEKMDWKQNLRALMLLNLVFFLWAIIALMLQDWFFWNPAGKEGWEPTLAFNKVLRPTPIFSTTPAR